MDRGTWWASAHEVAESDTTEHTHTIIISVRRRITPVPVVSFREASTRPEVYGTKHRTTWGMTRWGGGQEVKEIDDGQP